MPTLPLLVARLAPVVLLSVPVTARPVVLKVPTAFVPSGVKRVLPFAKILIRSVLLEYNNTGPLADVPILNSLSGPYI